MNTELRNEWADIRPHLGNLICHIDGKMESLEAEEKRISERRDESYWQGVQDFYEAVKHVAAAIEDDGMAMNDIKKYFGTRSIVEAICKTDPKTIMETVNKWKADKNKAEEEFQIGDEVLIGMSPISAPNELLNGIVTATMGSDILCVHIPESKVKPCPGYNVLWLHTNKVRKTGRHFDEIPLLYFDKGETNA